MKTSELKARMNQLDAHARVLWDEIVNLERIISQYLAEAEQNEERYEELMSLAMELKRECSYLNSSEDYRELSEKIARIESLIRSANEAMRKAEECKRKAEEAEEKLIQKKNELRSLLPDYEDLKTEISLNNSNLQSTISTLSTVGGMKYGGGAGSAITEVRKSLNESMDLLAACTKRIDAILSKCGDTETSPILIRARRL